MNAVEKARMMMTLQTKINLEEEIPLLYAGVLANEVLNHFDERTLQGVNLWMAGALTPEFKIGETSLAELQKTTGASLFGALCLMDVYLRDPDSMRGIRWAEWRDELK